MKFLRWLSENVNLISILIGTSLVFTGYNEAGIRVIQGAQL